MLNAHVAHSTADLNLAIAAAWHVAALVPAGLGWTKGKKGLPKLDKLLVKPGPTRPRPQQTWQQMKAVMLGFPQKKVA